MGSQLYFSLPFRVGLTREWVIPMNALVLCLSALASVPAIFALVPKAPRLVKVLLGAAFLGVHLFFAAGMVRNSLSDLPASVAALLSIWAIIVAAARGNLWLYPTAGLALGLSAMTRVFFLYPSLACAGVVLLVAAWSKEMRWRGVLFFSVFMIPILVQMFFTNKFTHHWAFIDPQSAAYGESLHFETITYGYDTLLPARGFRYDAPQCFAKSFGMADAVRKHAWGEALCLVAYREWFYFGSFTSGGEVYIPEVTDRHFSVPFLLANVASVLIGAIWVLGHARRRPLLFAVFVFLGAIWGQGGAIIPETRFMIAFYIGAWILAIGGLTEFTLNWRGHWSRVRSRCEHLPGLRSRNDLRTGSA
jgi:hypothetical protein